MGNMTTGNPLQQGLLHEIPAGKGPLAQRFLHPPFSVWNTREGDWQARKRAWLALGIQSEVGRDAAAYPGQDNLNRLQDKIASDRARKLAPGGEGGPNSLYRNMRESASEKQARLSAERKNNTPGRGDFDLYRHKAKGKETQDTGGLMTGTSIFDPVICELVYSWWCKPGGIIVDPFAGGSVRGIIASVMGYKYWGCELRQVQVDANREQLNARTTGKYKPKWRCGDSYDMLPDSPPADLIFSCPPYGNLEEYSDDPADISNKRYSEFLERYRAIISRACDRLRDNRFACFVVGNYRDQKEKLMRDLVGDTIRAFWDAGLELWNDIVLINAVGTAAARANTSFVRGHCKVVKQHQNVLVFVKGDAKQAAAQIPRDDGRDG